MKPLTLSLSPKREEGNEQKAPSPRLRGEGRARHRAEEEPLTLTLSPRRGEGKERQAPSPRLPGEGRGEGQSLRGIDLRNHHFHVFLSL